MDIELHPNYKKIIGFILPTLHQKEKEVEEILL